MKEFILIIFLLSNFLYSIECVMDNECPEGYFCFKNVGDCEGKGICEKKGCIPSPCIRLACGCDGKTYIDYTDAICNGININYYGKCIDFLNSGFYSYLLPVASFAEGPNGIIWKSDLIILNLENDISNVQLFLLEEGKENISPQIANLKVPAKNLIYLENFLNLIFSKTNIKGSVLITSSFSIFILSYNYSQSNDGKIFGQTVPAIELKDIPKTNDCYSFLSSYIGILEEDENFRTNLGLLNLSNSLNNIEVSVYSNKEKSSKNYGLVPYYFYQINSFLKEIGIENEENIYANLQSKEASTYFSYISLNDNKSNDPTFFPIFQNFSKKNFIPVVSNSKGGYDTNWKSDLYLINPQNEKININLKLNLHDGACSKEIEIEANSGKRINNIIEKLFPEISKDIKGSLIAESEKEFFISSRTYNETNKGTYGQYIPSASENLLLSEKEKGVIPYIQFNKDKRTNIGFSEFLGIETLICLEIYDVNGDLSFKKYYILSPLKNFQFDISKEMKDKELFMGYAVINVLSGGTIYAYSSVIDNLSGDAFFLEAKK